MASRCSRVDKAAIAPILSAMPTTHKLKSKTQTLPFLFIALTAGILMGLTTSPVEAWPLAWMALAPLWIFVNRKAEGGRRQEAQIYPKFFFLLPLLWGMGYHGVALFWITGIHPMTWMGVPWLASAAIALFCWLFITLWGAALVTIWALAMTWILKSKLTADSMSGSRSEAFGERIPASPELAAPTFTHKLSLLSPTQRHFFAPFIRVLIGVALWCSLEALWGLGPLYWTSLSYTQSPHNLAILHLGQISGPLTVTAAIVAVNGLIAEAWMQGRRKKAEGRSLWEKDQHRNRVSELPKPDGAGFLKQRKAGFVRTVSGEEVRGYIWPIALCFILHLFGFALHSRPLEVTGATALKVGIIQGNIPNTIKLFIDGKRRALDNYTAGYKILASQGVDAILTPEVALPFYLDELKRQSFYAAILEKGVVAWVGAYGERGLSYTNSLFTLTGTGEVVSRYDKVKLVPLGEYIPFEEMLGGIVDRLSPLNAHMAAGSASQLFDTPFGRAIVGICYESAFSEHFRRQAAAGGQFILTASNNAHYAASMPAQHHAQDVMRAIETDRWAVRATNTGYSGIVNPHGKTVWISGINTYEIRAATIYRRQTRTLYVRWGNWLTPVLSILAAIAWLLFYRQPTSIPSENSQGIS